MKESITAGRLKVLWVHKEVGWGGAETLLLNTARTIDHESFDVSCVFIQVDDFGFVREMERSGVSCIDLSDRGGGLIGRLVALGNVVRRGDWDVVHLHSPLPGSVARIASKCKRSPRPALITTEHSTWGSFHPATRLLNAATIKLDNLVIAVSEETYRSMSQSVRAKARVIIHGVLGNLLVAESKTEGDNLEWECPPNTPILVTVANLRAEKDHMTLLGALRCLVDRGVDFHSLLVGKGEARDQIADEVTRLGLDDRVELLGSRRDVPRILASSDLFVLSSVKEGMPVAIMEALALGIPVVSTAVGGIPEHLKGTGAAVLVEAGNPVALALAIEQVLTDNCLRHDMGLSAGALAANRFDLRYAVAETEVEYRRLGR